jgi:pimeloyl-ACP methyl ester carboxylesterase
VENIFNYESGKIHFTDKGFGNTIILLHGYLESSEVWNGFEEKLAKHFRVISVDLPGHGLSDVYSDTHSMEFMAAIVKELLNYLGIEKVFLAGHSLGGYVTLAFLELYPEYLAGYSLFHSHPLSDSPEAIEKRLREIELVKAGNKELIYPDNVSRMFASSNLVNFSGELQRVKEIASRIPGEGIIAVLNGMMIRPSRLSLMEEGRVPCLWVLGLMDNYIPCEMIQSKVRLPENAKLIVLKNSGHIGFIEEVETSVKAIQEFVANLP